MSDRLDAFPPVERVTIERQRSGWIIVRLDGVVRWKRYTRDQGFTKIKVEFYSNRSPAVPRSSEAFTTCHLLGSWRPGRRLIWGHNGFTVDLPAPGDHQTYNAYGVPLHAPCGVSDHQALNWPGSEPF